MFDRFQINQEIKFKLVLNIKNLFLDILNHEYDLLDRNSVTYLLEKLKEFFK
jgi:hypothetical protein